MDAKALHGIFGFAVEKFMITVPIFLIASIILWILIKLLTLATICLAIAWGVYKVKKDKDKAAKFRKATMGTGITALVLIIILTLTDFFITTGWPPRTLGWLMDLFGGGEGNNNNAAPANNNQ